MREAIGGALLIKIMLFFLVLFNSLLAVAVNYSQAFRVKNQIINYIEQYEGYESAVNHIDSYLSTMGYYRKLHTTTGKGYEVSRVTSSRGNYYKVTTYIAFEFPIVGNLFNFPIIGETKVITNDRG